MEARILRLDLAGQPVEWINWQTTVCLYARDLVSWSLGGIVRQARGGFSRCTGTRTVIDIPAIVACHGGWLGRERYAPPLTNPALFARDNYQCLYCGNYFAPPYLSRDHVHPRSRGGRDRWENVVAACKRCNSHKGDKLLKDISMDLLALPYRPNTAEYLALINNKRLRGDQAEYLRPQFNHLQHI
jgi:5-methylcytosine-specific restriction endonuclease McrA